MGYCTWAGMNEANRIYHDTEWGAVVQWTTLAKRGVPTGPDARWASSRTDRAGRRDPGGESETVTPPWQSGALPTTRYLHESFPSGGDGACA